LAFTSLFFFFITIPWTKLGYRLTMLHIGLWPDPSLILHLSLLATNASLCLSLNALPCPCIVYIFFFSSVITSHFGPKADNYCCLIHSFY